MRKRRSDHQFNGVKFEPTKPATPYRAWIKHKYVAITLGRYLTAEEAAVAADLARYLCWGLDPTKWYNEGCRRMSKPPNFAPVANPSFDRDKIIAKLVAHRCLDVMTIVDRLAEYDALAKEVEATFALNS
jgi:hypothetical protein